MKKVFYLLFLICSYPCFGQVENTIKKYRLEINYQRHYSFRKIWWLDTVNDDDRKDSNPYAYASPDEIMKREKEDSPVYSQGLCVKFIFFPIKWMLLQFGTATGTKGYGSESYIRERNIYPRNIWETYCSYKPASFIEVNYSLGPKIHLFKKKFFTVQASIGHSIHFLLPQRQDEVNLLDPKQFGYQYRGIYSINAKKGFTFNNVNSEYTTLTPFMTIFNFGINYSKRKYSIGINGTYEWNAKKYETRAPGLGGSMLMRNYIYTYGVSLGYCW